MRKIRYNDFKTRYNEFLKGCYNKFAKSRYIEFFVLNEGGGVDEQKYNLFIGMFLTKDGYYLKVLYGPEILPDNMNHANMLPGSDF